LACVCRHSHVRLHSLSHELYQPLAAKFHAGQCDQGRRYSLRKQVTVVAVCVRVCVCAKLCRSINRQWDAGSVREGGRVTAAAEAEEVVAEAEAAAAAGVVAVAVEVAGAIRGRGKTTGGTSQTMNFRQRRLRSESINTLGTLCILVCMDSVTAITSTRAHTHTHTRMRTHAL
jgi:hypothetical protein